MNNGDNLTQSIIANQPRVTIFAGPQTIPFQKIQRKCRAKTAAKAQI